MDFVNNNNLKIIFPNKSQLQLMCKNYKNTINNAAHGKTYKIEYLISSLYSEKREILIQTLEIYIGR